MEEDTSPQNSAKCGFLRQLQIESILGLGKFGIVFKSLTCNDPRAVRLFIPTDPPSANLLSNMLRLCNILEKQHQNVVSIYRINICDLNSNDLMYLQNIVDDFQSCRHSGRTSDLIASFISRAKRLGSVFCVISELQLCGPSLRKWLDESSVHKMYEPTNSRKQAEIVRGIIDGLQFLHCKEIIHRKLNPGCILFSHSAQPSVLDGQLLIDLYSLPVKIGNYSLSERPQFDATVVDPEEFMYDPPDEEITKQWDLYSLGLIMWEVLAKIPRKSRPQMFHKLIYDKNYSDIAEHAIIKNSKQLIIELTARSIKERIGSVEDVQLQWDPQFVKCDYDNPYAIFPDSDGLSKIDTISQESKRSKKSRLLKTFKSLFSCASNSDEVEVNDSLLEFSEQGAPLYASNDIKWGEVIGGGHYSYSIVHDGILIPHNLPIVLKSCKERQSSYKEFRIMLKLGQHDNIVKLLGWTTQKMPRESLWIIMELCESRNLQGYLRQYDSNEDPLDKSFIPSAVGKWGWQIASAMEHMQSKRIIHGDLALRNVLLRKGTAVLIDFGTSVELTGSDVVHQIDETQLLPFAWLAIETITNLELSHKSDVWSFGVLLWEMFSLGMLPTKFYGNFDDDFIKKLQYGIRLPKPIYASVALYGLMLRCWKADSQERPDFKDIKEYYEINYLGKDDNNVCNMVVPEVGVTIPKRGSGYCPYDSFPGI